VFEESTVGKVFHFMSIGTDGMEYPNKGQYLDSIIGENENTYYIMKLENGEEVQVSPTMMTSLY